MALPRPDNQRRRRTVERPSEAATGSSRRIVNRVRRDPAAARSRSGSLVSRPDRAKPGGTLLTPTPARTSCRSPFDLIEGDASRRGDLLFPGVRGPALGRDRCAAQSDTPPGRRALRVEQVGDEQHPVVSGDRVGAASRTGGSSPGSMIGSDPVTADQEEIPCSTRCPGSLWRRNDHRRWDGVR
jgi:hypothetical protein